jgi:hypothetical protein
MPNRSTAAIATALRIGFARDQWNATKIGGAKTASRRSDGASIRLPRRAATT